jgi:hypothetical protein
MSPELADKVFSLYTQKGGPPTPNQIQKYITEGERDITLREEAGFDVPKNVLDKFINSRGRLIADRFNEFKKSAKRLSEKYDWLDLAAVNISCIRKDGSINERKFRKQLKKGVI